MSNGLRIAKVLYLFCRVNPNHRAFLYPATIVHFMAGQIWLTGVDVDCSVADGATPSTAITA